MDSNLEKTLIIPDVHGRNFWKRYNFNDFEKVIFLGDYIDPFPDEGIGYTTSFNNFKEIIEVKKKYGDKFVLLLGNHDLHYMGVLEPGPRFNYSHAGELSAFFNENKSLFKLCYEIDVRDKHILFSHAGIHEDWLDIAFPQGEEIPNENISIKINELFEKRDKWFIESLDILSYERGGKGNFGSMVWADITEFFKDDVPLLNRYYQVVGHTCLSIPITLKNIACIDVQRGFILNEYGKITEDDGSKIKKVVNIKVENNE